MALPKIYDALEVFKSDGTVVLEVQSNVGGSSVRAIAMDSQMDSKEVWTFSQSEVQLRCLQVMQ